MSEKGAFFYCLSVTGAISPCQERLPETVIVIFLFSTQEKLRHKQKK